MKAMTLGAMLLTGCSAAAMRPWPQSRNLDEPSCLAACEKHYKLCPEIFAAFPERGAVECPASRADCEKSCKETYAVAAPAHAAAPATPTGTSKEAKLRELKRLYEQGLITEEVYTARQLAILAEP